MALSTADITRIKAELGWNVLTVGAEPFIGVAAIFSQVIQPFMTAGATTTTSSAVTASSTPAPATLVLTDPTGFSAGDRVFVDVDDLQESGTIRSLSGSNLGVLLRLAHTGTYPVTVDGGEGIVREILKNIRDVKRELGQTFGEGAIKQVDELGFYATRDRTMFGNIGDQLKYWRRELSQILTNGQGINMWERALASSQRLSVY